jgi:multidrug efflux pump subunit AcrA (membrane-fusion protein)
MSSLAVCFITSQRPDPVADLAGGISKIFYADLHVVLQGLGTVTPVSTVTLQTQINEQLTEVGYEECQLVKKGEFLAQIDPRPYEARSCVAITNCKLGPFQVRCAPARHAVRQSQSAAEATPATQSQALDSTKSRRTDAALNLLQ